MTEDEIKTEWRHRYNERLAILGVNRFAAEVSKFEIQAREIAAREADEWEANYRKQNKP